MKKRKADKDKSVKSHIIKNMVFLNVPKEEIAKILGKNRATNGKQ